MTRRADGADLVWRFENLIAGHGIGMEMPSATNPGPFAARVTFFAPVSLLFFLTVMVIAGATSGPGAAPDALLVHLRGLFRVPPAARVPGGPCQPAPGVCHRRAHERHAGRHVRRAIAGATRLVVTTGAAQVIFLVLFSYAFFLEGFTGLTITIGAIVTLFVLMQATARVAWDDVFGPGAQIPSGEVGHAARR